MTKEEIIDKHHNLNLGLLSITEKQIHSAMDEYAQQEAIAFAEWILKTNWAEKETWGRYDPPSTPTMKELYQLYLKHKNEKR